LNAHLVDIGPFSTQPAGRKFCRTLFYNVSICNVPPYAPVGQLSVYFKALLLIVSLWDCSGWCRTIFLCCCGSTCESMV